MKKNIYGVLFLVAVAFSVLTSCISDGGNKFTLSRLMCTVVYSTPERVVVQIDALGAYYYANEFAGQDMQLGERYLLTQMTVNNDEQPAGANGTISNPVLMTEVTKEFINTKPAISESQENPELPNDSVELFYAPYINTSKMLSGEKTYITFSGGVARKSEPVFRLVYTGRIEDSKGGSNDTLCYEFKTEYTKAGEKGNMDSYAQCFTLSQYMKSEQIVKVDFRAKRYQATDITSINKSYCVIKAPKTSSQED